MPIDTRHPREIRQDIRRGKLAGITAGLGQNYVQANLAVLPKEQAYDFLLFCQRNPRPCPLLEVTDVGSPEPVGVAPGADLRMDIPRYRIYKDGVLADEVTDATPYWRDDLVAFLLGCSFTFEWALLEAGIDLWHVKHGKNVAMWKTSTACRPAGVFHGPMVVSMRPIPSTQLAKAVTASARFPNAHGAPVHIGDPAALGIKDVTKPDWGDAQPFRPGDVPVFWACGVTPQAVALASKPPFMLTHSPGTCSLPTFPTPRSRRSRLVRFLPAGDLAISVELGEEISAEVNTRVRALEYLVDQKALPGVVETVPSYRSLLVYYDPSVVGYDALCAQLAALAEQATTTAMPPAREVELPCCYEGELGTDLEAAAARLGLSVDELVALHAGAE